MTLCNVLVYGGLRIHTVPKVASTSISAALDRHMLSKVPPDQKGDGWRFMVVRHPLDRLVSAWQFFTPAIRLQHMQVFRHNVQPDMQFGAFLDVVLKDPWKDRHTIPQVDWTGGQTIDQLVKLESLPDEWETLRSRFEGLKPITHRNKTEHGGWQEYFTDAMADAALEKYGMDLELYEHAS